jgi:parallel beta helix pectate lyase-like protein
LHYDGRLVGRFLLFAAVAAAFSCLGVAARAADAPVPARDDTAWMQAALDAGGHITLAPLPGGACYQTRGLWVSVDGTRIDSTGACLQYLGPGPVRLHSSDGDPIASNALLFVNRSSDSGLLPQHISISNLRLVIPRGTDGYGVLVAGSDVTLANIRTSGSALDAVTITGRANGRGYAGPVTVKGGTFAGARRNGISVVGAVGVTITSNVITGAGNAATGSDTGPWAGIDVEPDIPTYPIAQLTISNNTISSNRGSGILLALATNAGLPAVADGITITGNRITRNAASHGPFLRGGICLQGGQADGRGHLAVSGNTITYNGGYGLCKDPAGYRMLITLGPNVIYGNESGNSQW